SASIIARSAQSTSSAWLNLPCRYSAILSATIWRVIFIEVTETLQLFVAQIDGKFLVHGNKTTGSIVNFLHESGRVLIGVDFFDVKGASTCTAGKLANVSSTAIRQFFPMSKFAFVLGARCHRASRLS